MNKEEQVISAFWDLFSKKIWLEEYKMKEKLKDYNPSELHCMEYIEKNVDINVTKLAETFYMTRSAISKLAKKLMKKGLVESYQKPHNKKEIYFKLTEHGKEINKIHEKLHEEFEERDKIVFEQISNEQIENMIFFAKMYSKHLDKEIEKLGVDIRAKNYDKL